jgi:hypothetical protein
MIPAGLSVTHAGGFFVMHPTVAAAAVISPNKLVDWMMKFQFDSDVDYFTIDPVAYAPALGKAGMATYRSRLEARRLLSATPLAVHSHEQFVLQFNDQRLAVFDRDFDAIIATHAEIVESQPGCTIPPKHLKKLVSSIRRSIGRKKHRSMTPLIKRYLLPLTGVSAAGETSTR